MKEIEIKLRVLDREAVVRQLQEMGWRPRGERELERNFVYDRPESTLKAAGCLLRVREAGERCRLTLKTPTEDQTAHKVRNEHEIEAKDSEALHQILQGLGYCMAWRYEKYRTYYQRSGDAGEIALDETPIGDFLELEGDAGWIDRTAAEFGRQPQDYITANYGELFEEYRSQNRGMGDNMVFAAAVREPGSGDG